MSDEHGRRQGTGAASSVGILSVRQREVTRGSGKCEMESGNDAIDNRHAVGWHATPSTILDLR